MKTQTYTIKPLKWEKTFDSTSETYRASVPMGSYSVRRYREGFEEGARWESWQFKYCFDEYYDEDGYFVSSAKEGKECAEKDWLIRILPALKPVKK